MCGYCTCGRQMGFSWIEEPLYYEWLIIVLQIMKYFIITIFILEEYWTKLTTLASVLYFYILSEYVILNAT